LIKDVSQNLIENNFINNGILNLSNIGSGNFEHNDLYQQMYNEYVGYENDYGINKKNNK